MAKGYRVVSGDVFDPEGWKAYMAANAGPFRKYEGRFLVRGGRSEAVEGRLRSRIVVVEFPSLSAALDCYRSPEYAEAMRLREGKGILDIAVVEGYGGPQPLDA